MSKKSFCLSCATSPLEGWHLTGEDGRFGFTVAFEVTGDFDKRFSRLAFSCMKEVVEKAALEWAQRFIAIPIEFRSSFRLSKAMSVSDPDTEVQS